MRRIFWDSMLLIYLLDGNATYADRVQELLEQSFRRSDLLFTSYLGLGEVLAGSAKASNPRTSAEIRGTIDAMGFAYLPFGEAGVATFSELRAIHRVKSADAINLACAAAVGIDLFLTGDKALHRLHIPGIHFIAGFDTPLM